VLIMNWQPSYGRDSRAMGGFGIESEDQRPKERIKVHK
jgi:hypothetical protein